MGLSLLPMSWFSSLRLKLVLVSKLSVKYKQTVNCGLKLKISPAEQLPDFSSSSDKKKRSIRSKEYLGKKNPKICYCLPGRLLLPVMSGRPGEAAATSSVFPLRANFVIVRSNKVKQNIIARCEVRLVISRF